MLETIATLLPPALAIALSPFPVIGVILVLGTPRARTNGPAFAIGWVTGIVVITTLVVLLGDGNDAADAEASTGVAWGKVALGVLLLALAARKWRHRPKPGQETPMPGWMSGLDRITPVRAGLLGLALSAVNPKNLLLTLAGASLIVQADLPSTDTLIVSIVFVVLTSITVAGAVASHLLAPARVDPSLQRLKAFMVQHNAAIMAIVFVLLGGRVLYDGLTHL